MTASWACYPVPLWVAIIAFLVPIILVLVLAWLIWRHARRPRPQPAD